jgi:hypothetical protein
MSLGPGKYDALCTYVREQANAEAALVLILNGEQGSGFSIQGHLGALLALADVLETHVLKKVREQLKADLAAIEKTVS